MDNDIYRKPEAELIDESNSVPTGNEFEHYVLPLSKLWIYSVISFGVFLLPWNYIHWRQIKQNEISDIWPVPRAIFSIFFIIQLFNAINETKENSGVQMKWSVGFSAFMYILFSITGNLLDQIYTSSGIEVGASYFILFFATLVVPIACISKAQRVANLACGDVDGSSNSHWTLANYAWVLFCIVLLALMIFGLLSSEI